jgi:hypothetical protein
MKRALIGLALLLAAGLALAAPPGTPEGAPPNYDEPVVLVRLEGEGWKAFGSGVAVHNGGEEFVWTAGHVVDAAEVVKTVVDPETGRPRVQVSYVDVKVVRELYKKGIKVGEEFRFAEVVRYSDLEEGYDLALLHSRAPLCKKGAVLAASAPKVGACLYHVGSPGGPPGYNSYIPGTMAARGRPTRGLGHADENPTLFLDQYNLNIAGGSSGGPVFCEGRVVGLVTQGYRAQPTISFGVPVEVIRKFAKECECEWAVDPKCPLPPNEGWRRACARTTPLPLPPDWAPHK